MSCLITDLAAHISPAATTLEPPFASPRTARYKIPASHQAAPTASQTTRRGAIASHGTSRRPRKCKGPLDAPLVAFFGLRRRQQSPVLPPSLTQEARPCCLPACCRYTRFSEYKRSTGHNSPAFACMRRKSSLALADTAIFRRALPPLVCKVRALLRLRAGPRERDKSNAAERLTSCCTWWQHESNGNRRIASRLRLTRKLRGPHLP